jgi:uncharacterized membrane protein (UPF0127 family)
MSRPWAALARAALACALPLALPVALPPAPASPAPPQTLPLEARWCPQGAAGEAGAGGDCVALEVADTPEEQRWGLMLRPPLARGRGMWFPFRPPRRARFWMHRTPASLDMLFVRGGRVVAIEAAAAPCPALPCPSYGPAQPVDGVLEIGAGEAARLGVAVGDPLTVMPLAPARPAP